MFARVENGVTKFSHKINRKRQNFGSETAVFIISMGIFLFLAAKKPTLFGGGDKFTTG